MPVERRLGDAGPVDHLVDADSPDSAARKEVVGGVQNAVPGVARHAAGGLGSRGHGLTVLDRPVWVQ